MPDQAYNELLKQALLGRKLCPGSMPTAHRCRPMFSFWGSDAGLPEGDIHAHRAYRIYIDYDGALTITGVEVVVDGELLSPCSGYAAEALDQFDFPAVLKWCLARARAD